MSKIPFNHSGNGYSSTCSCIFICWSDGFVCKRLGFVQVLHCYIFSHGTLVIALTFLNFVFCKYCIFNGKSFSLFLLYISRRLYTYVVIYNQVPSPDIMLYNLLNVKWLIWCKMFMGFMFWLYYFPFIIRTTLCLISCSFIRKL